MPTYNKDKFTELVKDCRKSKSDKIIHNASMSHALILAENLIQMASKSKKDIKILSGNLHEAFYNNLQESMQKALDIGCNVSLIVLDSEVNLSNSSFWNTIKKSNNGYVMQSKLQRSETEKTPHFILVGQESFRLETDHKQTKATACFNNPIIGDSLSTIFDKFKTCLN